MSSEQQFKRVSDPSVEASKGLIFYSNGDWTELKVDLKEGATVEGIYEYLSQRDISVGINDAKISELVEGFAKGEPANMETIAKAKQVRHGRDGKLDFKIELGSKKVEVTDEDGNVDFRDLNLIKEIFSGQEIATTNPPDLGEDGETVQGKAISAIQGKKAKFRLGKNVNYDEDKNIIYATSDGHVEFLEPLISVHEEFVVNQDVDFTIGNLSFIGSLAINGNVPSGFTMNAGKNITIQGTCSASNLSAKGDIAVESGIIGSENTKIECEGKLSAKFANEAHIVARGGIEIFYEAVRSQMFTMGKFIIANGAVRGGEVVAYDGIEAKELGAPLGTPTKISVGIDYGVDEKIARLNAAANQIEEQKKKFQEVVEPYTKNKFLLLKAPEAKKSAVKTVLNKIEALNKKKKQIEAMVTSQEGARFNRTKQVEITGSILDDVTLQIGNKKKKFDNFGKRKGVIMYDKSSFEIVFSKRG
jgi:uncharacterized protein